MNRLGNALQQHPNRRFHLQFHLNQRRVRRRRHRVGAHPRRQRRREDIALRGGDALLAQLLDLLVLLDALGDERARAVDSFQSGDGDLFLISLKAGGTGLNLTAATQVVHFDRWWNPAVEDQATDRAWRIGQTRPVVVHRMISEGTIDERIAEMIELDLPRPRDITSPRFNDVKRHILDLLRPHGAAHG